MSGGFPPVDKSMAGTLQSFQEDITRLSRRRSPRLPKPIGSPASGPDTHWVRAASLDGLNAANGAHVIFEVYGGNNFGENRRYSALVQFTQRAGVIRAEVFERGRPGLQWYIKTISAYVYELWLGMPAYSAPVAVESRSTWNGSVVWDSTTIVDPTAGMSQANISVQSNGGPTRGTAALRGITPSTYWDFWQDTDGTQALYVGNKTGGWRQFSGLTSFASAAWATSATSGSVINAARSISATLGTVLETSESLSVSLVSGGSGYTFLDLSSITKNPTNTDVVLRFAQLFSTVNQAGSFAWQIVQTP